MFVSERNESGMEVVDIQEQACRFPRIGNGRNDSNKLGQKGISQYSPEDEEDKEFSKRVAVVASATVNPAGGVEPGGIGGGGLGANRLRGWHHSSRIIRVARASGGKDRHSKVWTSKGLRDRRVRLSVATAIQFYDLQDRLGFEQPSKAVEWLIEAASDAIAELPSLNGSFPETPRQLSDEKMGSDGTDQGFDSPEMELDGDPKKHQQNQRQQLSLARSACSSTSETSKGSGLSLSRSEILVNRAKARDRARERTAKEKEREQESRDAHCIPNNPSFTELLTGGINNNGSNNTTNRTNSASQNNVVEPNLFEKATAMDYLASSGIIGQQPSSSSSSRPGHNQSAGFSGQILLGNPHQLPMSIPQFNVSAAENTQHDRFQHFSLVPDNLNDYNLNFTISAGLAAGCNRGTLQSNISPSLLPYLQRFPHLDGSNVPFFIGAASPTTAAPVQLESHHQLTPALFDGSWQLCYADGSHHSDQKGKGKN